MGVNGYSRPMIEVSTAETANDIHRLLRMVDSGQSVRITRHGRPRARLVPDAGFMSGEEFAKVFAGYQATDADRAAADEIEAEITRLNAEEDRALDH